MTTLRYARPDARPSLRALFLRPLAVALLLALAPSALAQAVVSRSLTDALAALPVTGSTTVIVAFDQAGPPTAAQMGALRALGITRGVAFHSLPIAAVVATPVQVTSLAARSDVRSLWANEPLSYFNEGSRKITGVDRLRTDASMRTAAGLPFSGQGVTVLVNDSGIDATHADLQYGTHVVENAQALTNLNALDTLLPVTYLEGQPNTDTNSGHGTHCAGTVGGTGARSGGQHAGVAPGADLVGYGSGAVIAILDALGGFDYAITHQFSFDNPIRVISNSWGSEGAFDPADPINLASYRAYQVGINVVFAAGNSGSGADTHNPYAVAPWVISVGAGDKTGLLADFSSRGVSGQTFSFETPDGQPWTARNEITVTAPGVDVISTRSATNVAANGGDADVDAIPPGQLPFYTMISGTSMATPHVAGIIALVLEANPSLQPADVRRLLQQTATTMPGLEAWEAGAGYVNAYAAVQAALGRSARPFGSAVNAFRTFNANALVANAGTTPFSIDYVPVGATQEIAFEVAADISRVTASARVSDNTVALVLYDPAGNRYGSAISLPQLGETIAVSATGMPGTWRLTVRGIGSVSGVPTDPLGLTNGTSLPGTIAGTLTFQRTSGFEGLADVQNHPAAADIQYAVAHRLMDGYANNTFRPTRNLTRIELADYLTMGAGVRQYFKPDRTLAFSDVSGTQVAFAEAAAARGAALRNGDQTQNGLIRTTGAQFNPGGNVTRADLAYAFVQALGLQGSAAGYTGDVSVAYDGRRIAIQDAAQIPAGLRGYVQAALDLGIINARFVLQQGPFDLQPTLKAYFDPATAIKRADYAVYAGRFFDGYFNGFALPGEAAKTGSALAGAVPTADAGAAPEIALGQNVPNPFAAGTTIEFALSAPAEVELAVYDVTGREVARLADGPMETGSHRVAWDASGLASGVYLYRLQAGTEVQTRRMVVAR
jgi:serine protease AprX